MMKNHKEKISSYIQILLKLSHHLTAQLGRHSILIKKNLQKFFSEKFRCLQFVKKVLPRLRALMTAKFSRTILIKLPNAIETLVNGNESSSRRLSFIVITIAVNFNHLLALVDFISYLKVLKSLHIDALDTRDFDAVA